MSIRTENVRQDASNDSTTSITGDQDPSVAKEGPSRHLLESDLLIEEISIDGMCGVY